MGVRLLTDRARQIRRQNAEQRLLSLLRHRKLAAHRFRRHHTVGPFVVDFICIEQALIVELTADQHALGLPADESLGFRVLRFWDSEVVSDPKAVLARLLDALSEKRS
jgi:adenine-specific DNA-methyltransferase